MDDIWNQALSPIPQTATSPASGAPSSFPPESNGVPSPHDPQPINTLACIETPNKGKRKRSPYWAHFDKILIDGLQKAVCKYCSRHIGCDPKSGTSALKNHVERCKEYSPKSISDQALEEYSPRALASVAPWDMFPAARTLEQMMETMARLVREPYAFGAITWPSVPSTEGNGHRSGRTPWAIKESKTEYKIRFDMPGMTKKDVKVWVEEDTLVVQAEKVPKDGQQDGWPAENYGKYISRVALPETVNVEKITAEVKDGVLNLTVPKAVTTNRRIEINVQ